MDENSPVFLFRISWSSFPSSSSSNWQNQHFLSNPTKLLPTHCWARLNGGGNACTSNLNLNHFKMVYVIGLEAITLWSPTIASCPYKISSKSTEQLKRYLNVLYITAFMSLLTYSKVHALVSTVTSPKDCMWCNYANPTMLNNPNPLLSKAEWCR
jgi:hypothetical protein